jgi:hypothetical protein
MGKFNNTKLATILAIIFGGILSLLNIFGLFPREGKYYLYNLYSNLVDIFISQFGFSFILLINDSSYKSTSA